MVITIRTATVDDADRIAAIHIASWEANYRGLVPDEAFANRPLSVRRAQWKSWLMLTDRITLVACDENGAVQGFASAIFEGAGERYDSYLATLYVHPAVADKGIGRALLRETARRLIDAGARNMALNTLRLGSARGFYERLGARFQPDGRAPESGMFDDVVYVFDDLRVLAGV